MQRLNQVKNALMSSAPVSTSATPGATVEPGTSQIDRIYVWDFDNTLWASPVPSRDLWDGSVLRALTGSFQAAIGWWTDPRSIYGAKEEGWHAETGWIFDEGRWVEEKWVELAGLVEGESERLTSVARFPDTLSFPQILLKISCAKVRESIQDPRALTVLLTGRGHLKFNKALRRMCETRGLYFDVLGLKPPNDVNTGGWTLPFEAAARTKGFPDNLNYVHERKPGEPVTRYMNTLLFKRSFLEALAKTFPGVKEMSIFEDRVAHAREFEKIGADIVERGLVDKFQSIVVPRVTEPMPTASELAFIFHMVQESNNGLVNGMTILHRDEDSLLSVERVSKEDNSRLEVEVEIPKGQRVVDLAAVIGMDDIEAMDALRIVERGEDGMLKAETDVVVGDPTSPDYWTPKDSSWSIVTYQGPPPYTNRRVLGPMRTPHFLELVRVRGEDGKLRIGILPEPPMGKDAVDE